MPNLRRISALGFILLALSGGVALAQPMFDDPEGMPQAQQMQPGQGGGQGQGRRGPGGGGPDGLMQALNLTTEQQQQMKAIRDRYESQITQNRDALQAAHERMRQLMGSSASDQELLTQHNELQRLQTEMGDLRFRSMLEMRAILTPEQRTQMNQMQQQRQNNRGSRFNGGGGFGRGQMPNN